MFLSQSSKSTLSLLQEPPPRVPQVPSSFVPRLELLRAERWRNLSESLSALVTGPAPLKKFSGSPYFRDCWVAGRWPDRAFLASALSHAAFIMLLVQIWPLLPSPPRTVHPQVEITYYGPINDLPAILPARPIARRPVVAEPARIPAPQAPGADAYHPRQTIINNPLQPNHPRQTLIQPLAAPDPPKLLPSMPNIVAWNELAKPKLRIDPAALARLQPNAAASRQENSVAPEVANQEKLAGTVNVADLSAAPKPALPIVPMSAPKVAGRPAANPSAPEPDFAGGPDASGVQLIALSATPGPEMPAVVPAGNLSSRVAISPDGKTPGQPAGNAGADEGGGTGPPGLSITGGNGPRSSYSSLGPANPAKPSGRVMPGTVAAVPPSPAAPPPASVGARSPVVAAALKPGAKPETLLGPKHLYTLNINMPNLTSAMGSWILTFAEMDSLNSPPGAYPNPANLSGPEALRKVDPKYPPELRSKRVEGEVVLYAVIRKDGTVDSIQLVNGVDPVLDENAMLALAQWKFLPGERQGVPVDHEVIVRIPFHSVAPLY